VSVPDAQGDGNVSAPAISAGVEYPVPAAVGRAAAHVPDLGAGVTIDAATATASVTIHAPGIAAGVQAAVNSGVVRGAGVPPALAVGVIVSPAAAAGSGRAHAPVGYAPLNPILEAISRAVALETDARPAQLEAISRAVALEVLE